ncbi:MAG: hypothetical protein U1E65_09150 [Myxococcota bacterium]
MRRTLLISAWALLAACGESTTFIGPRAGAQSVLVLASGTPITGLAASFGESFDPLRLNFARAPDELVVAYYARPLSSLGLTPGPLSSAPEPAVGLPTPALLERATPGHELSPVEAGVIPETFSSFRIAAPDLLGCFGADACLIDGTCTAPCPPRAAVAPAAMANLPQALPCPPGWSETSVSFPFDGAQETAVSCDERSQCTGTAVPFVGVGCQELDDCVNPRTISPGPAVRFVAPGGVGDGSTAQSPLGSIAAAISAGASTVALALGALEAPPELTDSIRLVGACARGTRIFGAGTQGLLIRSGRAGLVGLEVDLGITLSAGATLSLDRALLRGRVESFGRLEGRHTLIEGGAAGIRGRQGTVVLTEVVLHDAMSAGLSMTSGSTATIERVRVIGGGSPGLESSGRVVARELVMEGLAGVGLAIEGGILELDRGSFRGFRNGGGAPTSLAISLTRSVSRLSGVLVDDVDLRGILAEEGRFQASDLMVRDIHDLGTGASVLGIQLQGPAADLRRVFTVGRMNGIVIGGDTSTATITDYIAVTAESGTRASGIIMTGPGNLLVQRAAFAARDLGLEMANLAGARLRFEDIRCDGTNVCLQLLTYAGPIKVEIERLDSLNSVEAALFEPAGQRMLGLAEGATVFAYDIVARSTQGARQRATARLVDLDNAAILHLERFALAGAFEAGIVLPWPSQQTFRDGSVTAAKVGVSVRVTGGAPPTDYSGILERVDLQGNDAKFELLR